MATSRKIQGRLPPSGEKLGENRTHSGGYKQVTHSSGPAHYPPLPVFLWRRCSARHAFIKAAFLPAAPACGSDRSKALSTIPILFPAAGMSPPSAQAGKGPSRGPVIRLNASGAVIPGLDYPNVSARPSKSDTTRLNPGNRTHRQGHKFLRGRQAPFGQLDTCEERC